RCPLYPGPTLSLSLSFPPSPSLSLSLPLPPSLSLSLSLFPYRSHIYSFFVSSSVIGLCLSLPLIDDLILKTTVPQWIMVSLPLIFHLTILILPLSSLPHSPSP